MKNIVLVLLLFNTQLWSSVDNFYFLKLNRDNYRPGEPIIVDLDPSKLRKNELSVSIYDMELNKSYKLGKISPETNKFFVHFFNQFILREARTVLGKDLNSNLYYNKPLHPGKYQFRINDVPKGEIFRVEKYEFLGVDVEDIQFENLSYSDFYEIIHTYDHLRPKSNSDGWKNLINIFYPKNDSLDVSQKFCGWIPLNESILKHGYFTSENLEKLKAIIDEVDLNWDLMRSYIKIYIKDIPPGPNRPYTAEEYSKIIKEINSRKVIKMRTRGIPASNTSSKVNLELERILEADRSSSER